MRLRTLRRLRLRQAKESCHAEACTAPCGGRSPYRTSSGKPGGGIRPSAATEILRWGAGRLGSTTKATLFVTQMTFAKYEQRTNPGYNSTRLSLPWADSVRLRRGSAPRPDVTLFFQADWPEAGRWEADYGGPGPSKAQYLASGLLAVAIGLALEKLNQDDKDKEGEPVILTKNRESPDDFGITFGR
jgi:hypothetical protein